MSKQDFKPGSTFFQNLGKFIGGGLGWGLGGPLGAIIGVAIGSLIDNIKSSSAGHNGQTTRGDFTMSLLVLVAAIMKADGTVRKVELDYVKQFLVRNFGRDGAVEALRVLQHILKQNIDIAPVCIQIRENMDYASRLQLIYFLVNIAAIDGHFDTGEEQMLDFIAGQTGISAADRESIRSMFGSRDRESYSQTRQTCSPSLEQAYRVLEVDPGADAATVKKAYRALAVKHHPDKVAYLGEDVKKAANEKFQRLNEAYEIVKKNRGFV
jgi:DnaJ like chaperone protein